MEEPACRPSERLERIPPYLFAELERKIAAKRAAGVDVISLGHRRSRHARRRRWSSRRMQRGGRRPGHAPVPVQPRPRRVPRGGRATSTRAASASSSTPTTEVMPAIGAKECIFNLNLAFLDPGDVALAADPGYPVYTGGPLLAGAEAVLMPLLPELGFAPDLDAIAPRTARAGEAACSSTTRTTRPARSCRTGFFERVVEFARAERRAGRARQRLHARRPTTATWRRRFLADARRQGRRASRSSRSPRATT